MFEILGVIASYIGAGASVKRAWPDLLKRDKKHKIKPDIPTSINNEVNPKISKIMFYLEHEDRMFGSQPIETKHSIYFLFGFVLLPLILSATIYLFNAVWLYFLPPLLNNFAIDSIVDFLLILPFIATFTCIALIFLYAHLVHKHATHCIRMKISAKELELLQAEFNDKNWTNKFLIESVIEEIIKIHMKYNLG